MKLWYLEIFFFIKNVYYEKSVETNFRKTVESGVDPRLAKSDISNYRPISLLPVWFLASCVSDVHIRVCYKN